MTNIDYIPILREDNSAQIYDDGSFILECEGGDERRFQNIQSFQDHLLELGLDLNLLHPDCAAAEVVKHLAFDNEKLLAYAETHRPPQEWWDDTDNPFDAEQQDDLTYTNITFPLGTELCPFCGKYCMYIEKRHPDDPMHGFRVGADCDELMEYIDKHPQENDALGNDFGRTQFNEELLDAIDEWNLNVSDAKVRNSHACIW